MCIVAILFVIALTILGGGGFGWAAVTVAQDASLNKRMKVLLSSFFRLEGAVQLFHKYCFSCEGLQHVFCDSYFPSLITMKLLILNLSGFH